MQNKKLKRRNIEATMRLNVLEKARDIDYCGVWLALLDGGVSRPRVLRLYDNFHEEGVPAYQQLALDEVLDVRLDKFIKEVQIPRETFEQVVKRHSKEISAVFPTAETYAAAIQSNATDFLVLMYHIHLMLGYGHIRLLRIIEFIMSYEGDAQREVKERLGIEYSEPDELAYSPDMLKVPKQRVDMDFVKRAQKEMEALRELQNALYRRAAK